MKRKPSGGKAVSRRSPKKGASTQQSINTQTHSDAAGIDVGAEEFVVAVPPGRCEEPVRTYTTFTSGVHAPRDFLLECDVKTAAMESTGNYWITLYDVLTEAGIEVYLVNARYVKGVPGKKTDVCDAQWLQQLHAAGLLRKSFRPALGIVPLRFLMRHRAEMVGDAAKQLQLMQKSLTEMNLKLQHVFSDIDGVSAQAIIDAILAGERDAKKLAALRDKRCRSSAEDIIEALRGDYREEYLFVLGQSQRTYRQLREAIAACDEKLGELAARVECEVSGPLPEAPKGQRHVGKNSPQFAVFETAWRFYGVDLGGVLGLQKSQTEIGGYLRRMKGILGKAEGTTAAAHKLARIVHGMIKSQKPYDEKEAFKLTPQSEARSRKALEKQAAALGFTLQPAAA